MLQRQMQVIGGGAEKYPSHGLLQQKPKQLKYMASAMQSNASALAASISTLCQYVIQRENRTQWCFG